MDLHKTLAQHLREFDIDCVLATLSDADMREIVDRSPQAAELALDIALNYEECAVENEVPYSVLQAVIERFVGIAGLDLPFIPGLSNLPATIYHESERGYALLLPKAGENGLIERFLFIDHRDLAAEG